MKFFVKTILTFPQNHKFTLNSLNATNANPHLYAMIALVTHGTKPQKIHLITFVDDEYLRI